MENRLTEKDEIKVSEETRENKEPEKKSESGVKAFIIIMTGIVIITAALTSGTYTGYDPSSYSVAITGFFVIVTIVMTSLWYRTKYNNYAYKPKNKK
jgi:heme/copper-type cytochrome/quinol oxidase subunit 4